MDSLDKSVDLVKIKELEGRKVSLYDIINDVEYHGILHNISETNSSALLLCDDKKYRLFFGNFYITHDPNELNTSLEVTEKTQETILKERIGNERLILIMKKEIIEQTIDDSDFTVEIVDDELIININEDEEYARIVGDEINVDESDFIEHAKDIAKVLNLTINREYE